MSDTLETMNTNMLRNLYETQEHRVSVGDIWDHAAALEHERDELIHAARSLKAAKGRFHTQQAAERLFKLIP